MKGGGRLSEHAGWYFQVYVRVRLLRGGGGIPFRSAFEEEILHSWVACAHIGLRVKGAGSKNARDRELAPRITPTMGGGGELCGERGLNVWGVEKGYEQPCEKNSLHSAAPINWVQITFHRW